MCFRGRKNKGHLTLKGVSFPLGKKERVSSKKEGTVAFLIRGGRGVNDLSPKRGRGDSLLLRDEGRGKHTSSRRGGEKKFSSRRGVYLVGSRRRN